MDSVSTAFERTQGWSRQAEEILAATRHDPEQRALRLAQGLAAPDPGSLSACVLRSGGRAVLRVVDGDGARQTEWEDGLAETLDRAAEREESGPFEVARPVALAGLGDVPITGTPVVFRQHNYGCLAAAGAPFEQLRLPLAHAAETLALLLGLEQQHEQEDLLRQELTRQTGLSKVGELTNQMAHEFNNALNGIVLHLAVIGLDAPEKLRTELGVIRNLANGAASHIRKLQDYSRRLRPTLEPVDLNNAVSETVAWLRGLALGDAHSRTLADVYFPDGMPAALASAAAALDVRLAQDLPPVLGARAEVSRLLRLLIAGAAPLPGSPKLTLYTERSEHKVVLRLERPGDALAAEAVARLLDPFAALQPGEAAGDLALGKAIVRRLQGSMHADARSEGGLTIQVELQVAGA